MTDLSNRALKAFDRQHGAYLVLPWPAELPTPKLADDEERQATPAEHLAATRLVAPIAQRYALIHIATQAGRLRRPQGVARATVIEPYLMAQLVTTRWLGTSHIGRQAPAVWVIAI